MLKTEPLAIHARRPILVAGKSGQLAQAMLDAACTRHIPLVVLGRPELDVTEADSIDRAMAALKPSAIVNASAYTAVDQAEAEPDHAYAVNCEGAERLARAAASAGIPFIHLSTDYVFDGSKALPYLEDDAPAPLGIYGQSKLKGEIAVCCAHPTAVVVRTSWVYSPSGRNFVKTMLRLATSRDVVQVVDDQHGAPTAAADLAQAVLDLLKRVSVVPASARLYHLTASGETTWHGFATAIMAGWARRGRRVASVRAITSKQFGARALRPANSRLDCSRIAEEFGVRLPPWQQSLDLCLDALAKPGSGIEAI